MDVLNKCDEIRFFIQDVEHTVKTSDVTPNTSLNTYLRNYLNLKGTKGMCYEGGCGACLVVVENIHPVTQQVMYLAVNSCLVSILTCHDWKMYTIEGIGNPLKGYHPIQEVLAKYNGTQCGFCSSGMVMNMYALYKSGKLQMNEVENSFGGNICRCTGYRPILSAFKSLCTDYDNKEACPDIEDAKICQKKTCAAECKEKCKNKKPVAMFHEIYGQSKWIKVFDLKTLLCTLKTFDKKTYMLVAGNTAQGVFKSYKTPVDNYLDIGEVTELRGYQIKDGHLLLGGTNSLNIAMEIMMDVSQHNPEFAYLKKLAEHIDLIASVPVRNLGTIAGNLMMKHDFNDFPSDVFLTLETVGATVILVSASKPDEEIESSLLDFIKADLHLKVVKCIKLPPLGGNVKFESYKIMPRAQNAHAIVNAGFLFDFDNNDKVKSARIVYGNINPTFVHATNTETLLINQNLFDNNTIQKASASLLEEIKPVDIPPDPSPEFRRQLAVSLFYKTVLSMAPTNKLSPRNASGGPKLVRPLSSGVQDFETKASLYPLTEPINKLEALAQTTGQAEYVEDMPDLPYQLYAAFVLAEAPPKSRITNIDASQAKNTEGVVAFYTKDEIPGDNNFTPLILFPQKELIFCEGEVQYYHQPIGVIIGTDFGTAQKASHLVKVTYSPPTEPPYLSVREVLKAGKKDRIHPKTEIIPQKKGDDIKQTVTGTFDIYQQYHFHMETQCCNVIPNEDGLDVYPTSQWMDQIQIAIANMLQIPNSKVNLKIRRCGGAFGAKISRNGIVACAAALAAWKLRRPVKMILPLTTNMNALGKRWPLSVDYETGINKDGVIQYLKTTHYSDQGATDNETGIHELIGLFMGTYDSDTYYLSVNTAKTDTPTNTWCRAPGTTEGLAAIEAIMDHIAYTMDLDPLDVRVANLRQETELLGHINDLKEWADIDERKKEIAQFNKDNRWKKKGIAVVPMAYKFAVFGPYTATVSIFHGDGSVSISHGGIEVGQGINTKAAQVCAYKLGIPLEKISVIPSRASVSPNCVPTGGSAASEGVCYAVLKACEELLSRMKPFRDQTPSARWEEVVENCFRGGVTLTTTGMYNSKIPELKDYTIYGVTAAEVLVDILSAQFQLTRVDLLEDIGMSLSPAIDIGQVEGAFVMGLGYYTSEHIVFDEQGKLLTNNTWTYKPPGAKDIPIDFRVKFPKNGKNPGGVLNSKAIAEPPLCMTIVVPLALRNAVASARIDAHKPEKWYPIDGPTSVENVYMNSMHNYTEYVL